eukprot:TRINITY_DN13900_c0_g1_i3.p1 TRINITY_DN13900_c0_g1~~TRINITY_DN13900_c0_g1_i3.p1  ORF type:complete len:262 (-),score=60.49 TRINITY_DN13900_c0_g1_i3:52-837(-)
MKSVILSAFSVLALAWSCSAACNVGFSYTFRSQWTSNDATYAIYDLTMTNTGSCTATLSKVLIGGSGMSVSQVWNADSSSVGELRFEPEITLQPGQVNTAVGAIFLYDATTSNGDPKLTLAPASCPAACAAPAPAPVPTPATVNCTEFSASECPSAECMVTTGTHYCGPASLFCVPRPVAPATCNTGISVCGVNIMTNEIAEFSSDCLPEHYHAFEASVPTCASGTLTCPDNQICIDSYLHHTCAGKCRPAMIGSCINRRK